MWAEELAFARARSVTSRDALVPGPIAWTVPATAFNVRAVESSLEEGVDPRGEVGAALEQEGVAGRAVEGEPCARDAAGQ